MSSINNLCRLLLFAAVISIQSSCNKYSDTVTYTLIKPVYESKATVLARINSQPVPVSRAGKIFVKDNYIFLNDVDKGVHVINNANPAQPVEEAFLNIPGNQDVAVLNNILYADMYGDLLALDITNLHQVKLASVIPNFFIQRRYVNGYQIDDDKVVTNWIRKDTTVSVEAYNAMINPICPNCAVNDMVLAAAANSKAIAGSMAKMVLMNNYLYAIVEPHSLGIVDVNNPPAPKLLQSFFAGFDLETVYPFEDKLFLGSATGMFMYDVADPSSPKKLGIFEHGRACDPVITDGNFAYVTLHAGTLCGGIANELHVINIADLMHPKAVQTYSLTKPTGLSKDGNLLFVCDSDKVRVYNAETPADLKQLTSITAAEPYDVITYNNIALVVAKDGLYQYDYTNPKQIKQLSKLLIAN